jgi:hypothetical protein
MVYWYPTIDLRSLDAHQKYWNCSTYARKRENDSIGLDEASKYMNLTQLLYQLMEAGGREGLWDGCVTEYLNICKL